MFPDVRIASNTITLCRFVSQDEIPFVSLYSKIEMLYNFLQGFIYNTDLWIDHANGRRVGTVLKLLWIWFLYIWQTIVRDQELIIRDLHLFCLLISKLLTLKFYYLKMYWRNICRQTRWEVSDSDLVWLAMVQEFELQSWAHPEGFIAAQLQDSIVQLETKWNGLARGIGITTRMQRYSLWSQQQLARGPSITAKVWSPDCYHQ